MGIAPPALAAPGPELFFGLQPYWDAFCSVTGDRQVGGMGGVGPIPWTSIDGYAQRHGITDPDDYDELHHFVRELDREYIRWANDDAEKKLKAAKASRR